MDPKDGEEICNTGPDEETIARDRKRSRRRVSFAAEITSVHVFDRDEEYETPPDSKPSSETPESEQSNEVLGFIRDVADGDDTKENLEDEEEEEEDERVPFVRDMDFSSSPGSAVGSATSNDEDNFFGPVSGSFIRSGRDSYSAASDDNHDLTLDSTAFSMHFRSLVHSDLEGSFKTRSENDFTFEDKTPIENSMPTGFGSSMVFTKAKKPVPHWPISGGNSSGDSGSNDMSLIESNPHQYDYARLSPRLGALLAEGTNDIDVISAPEKMSVQSNNLSDHSKFPILLTKELRNIGTQKTSTATVCYGSTKAMAGSITAPMDHKTYDPSVSTKDASLSDAFRSHRNQTMDDSSEALPHPTNTEFSTDSLKAGGHEPELGGGNDDHPVTPVNNTFPMNPTAKSDIYGGQIGDKGREESPKSERSTPVPDQNINHGSGILLEGSISSLSAKRQGIFVDTSVLMRSEYIATPFVEVQSSSFPDRNNIRHHDSIVSTRHISKFDISEVSPFRSTSAVGNEYLKSAFSSQLYAPTSFSTFLDETSNDSKLKQVAVSDTLPEEHSPNVNQKSNRKINGVEVEKSGVEPPNTKGVAAESIETEHDVRHSYHLSSGMLSTGESAKFITAVAPPGESFGSREDILQHPMISDNPTERTLTATETHSSVLKNKFPFRSNEQVTDAHGKFVNFPMESLEHTPHKQKGVLPGTSNQQDDYVELANLERIQESANAKADHGNMSYSTPGPKDPINVDSFLKEKNTHAIMDVGAVDIKDFGRPERIGNGEFLLPSYQKEYGNTANCPTPLWWSTAKRSPSGISDPSFRTRTDPPKFSKRVPERASLYKSASPHVRMGTAVAIRLEKRLEERIKHGSSMKETEIQDLPENEGMHYFVRKNPPSPRLLQYEDAHGLSRDHHCLKGLQGSVEVENSSRKRRVEEIGLMEKDDIDDHGRVRKSPKDMKGSILEFQSENCPLADKEIDMAGASASPGIWANAFRKFCGAMEELPLPSVMKQNTRELDKLEDMVDRLQKAKKYENLCSFIQHQTTHDQLENYRQRKRVTEAKRLQETLVFEKATMQLLRMKQEILRKKLEMLHSGIQKSQNLKSSLKNVVACGARDAQNKQTKSSSSSMEYSSTKEEAYRKLLTKRQEVGTLDQELNNLNKSVLASCKMKGERHPSETILVGNDILRNRERCRLIQKELQLWKVDNLENKNGHHTLVLNYCDFLFQRFTIIHGSVSKIITLNTLNDATIMKSFGNMNACMAFAFVFDAEAGRRLLSSKGLAVETQITSFRLGNLLDVVEEVQAAQIELRNLIFTSFHSPGVGLLELQFRFIDFETGNKVTLTLDMACLNRGIYPFTILPCVSVTQTSSALSAAIETAVAALRSGYSRILEICRCVSHVVQSFKQVRLICPSL